MKNIVANLKRSFLCTLAVLLVASCLYGCGFHLRGKKPLPPNLHVLHVQSNQPYSELTLQLERALRSLGIVLVDKAADAPVTLRILEQKFKSSTLTQSATNSIKQYVMTLTVSYQLQDKAGNPILGPKNAVVTQTLYVLENEVLSSGNELSVLRQNMQRDVMFQVLTQLSSEEASAAVDQVVMGAVVNKEPE